MLFSKMILNSLKMKKKYRVNYMYLPGYLIGPRHEWTKIRWVMYLPISLFTLFYIIDTRKHETNLEGVGFFLFYFFYIYIKLVRNSIRESNKRTCRE
jgi:hypothetical protein